jgi:hypothetical protein
MPISNPMWYRNLCLMSAGLFIFSFLIVFSDNSGVYALELYSKDDKPFGIGFDEWIGKWWNWWISVPGNEDGTITGLNQDGCLMNKSSSVVMLMETAVGGKYHQICEISSNQAIMVPLWTGWCDAGVESQRQYTYAQLIKCARESANLGIVKSTLIVDPDPKDRKPIATLSVISQDPGSGEIKYTKDSFSNVTEVYSNATKGFDITIPQNTHFPDQVVGTWRAGAHGWFVFLKLPPGTHELSYATGVNENIIDPEALGYGNFKQAPNEISYTLNVK